MKSLRWKRPCEGVSPWFIAELINELSELSEGWLSEKNSLKLLLWTRGARLTEGARAILSQANPFGVKRGGYSQAYSITIGEKNIGARVFEKRDSGILISGDSSALEISNLSGNIISTALPVEAPSLYSEKVSGISLSSIITAHSENQLVSMPYSYCSFFEKKKVPCGFCGVGANKERIVPVNLFEEAVRKVAEKTPGKIRLTINGGETEGNGSGIEKLIECAIPLQDLGNEGRLYLACEAMPPEDLKFLSKAAKYFDGISMNAEVWENFKMREIAPMKPTTQEYMNALLFAEEIFPKGSVASAIQPGMSGVNETLNEYSELAELVILPEILPYVPTNGNRLGKTLKPMDERDLALIAGKTGPILLNAGLFGVRENWAGCTDCGYCNLNDSLYIAFLEKKTEIKREATYNA